MSVSKIVYEGLGLSASFKNIPNLKNLRTASQKAVQEVINRHKDPSQILGWIELPESQLKRVDKIYELAERFKNATQTDKVVIMGIGGSRHTIEHVMGMLGLNLDKKIQNFSDICSIGFRRLMNSLDNKATNARYMIVSKSGETFETKDAMIRIKNMLENEIKAQYPRASRKEIEERVAKHLIAITDKDPNKSSLRTMANKENWLGQELQIHDGVGGRYSAFDDHVLLSLASSGMKKADMIDMLKAASAMSEMSMNPQLSKNMALKEAAFWVASKLEGYLNSVRAFFGAPFEETTTWTQQLYSESIKDTNSSICVIPKALHHSAEAFFNKANKYANKITSYISDGFKQNVNGYTKGVTKAFTDKGPTMLKQVASNEMGITPKATGAYTQSEHFAIIYEDLINKIFKNKALGENPIDAVVQPFVNSYKKEIQHLKPGNIK